MSHISTTKPPADQSLRIGSLSHYIEPSYYDKCYAKRRHDVQFYQTLVTERFSGAKVLAYGCGNGRIELPLARGGAHVYGVDLSQPMLKDFRRRLATEPQEVRERITLHHGDMRSFSTRRRFDLVLCTFNTFLHLYSYGDVQAFLSRVRRHLRPGGRFVFDASIPLLSELDRDPAHPYRIPRMRVPPDNRLVRYSERFDYDRFTQVLKILMTFEPIDAPDQAWSTLLTHRQFFPQEIVSLLSCARFEIQKIWPDFVEGTPNSAVDAIVWEAVPVGKNRVA